MSFEWYITPSHYSLALENGINEKLLTKRVRDYGWSIKRATTEPPQKRNQWDGWLEIAKKNKIPHATFYTMIYREGKSPEQAATVPPLPHADVLKRASDKTRIYPKEYQDIALKNGICRSAFTDRMRRGWSLTDATTKPISEKHSRKGATK